MKWSGIAAVALLAACSGKKVIEAPTTLPAPPLALAAPPLPPANLDGDDLSALDAPTLKSVAYSFYTRGHAKRAAHVGRWAVEKGADDRYDLACYYALAEQVDAAFYYLQQAATLEGVDGPHADEDADLTLLRRDPRWATVARHIALTNAYWAKHTPLETKLVLPRGAAPDQPLPLVIGLHGLGHDQTFVSDDYQGWADDLGVAILGISGTRARGRHSFAWAEDVAQDWAHVQAALAAVKGRLTYTPGRVMAFGFSQGGVTAFALAAAHPEVFSGAVAMSPGSLRPIAEIMAPVKARPESARQRFAVVAGADEHPSTVQTTRALGAWANAASAAVQLHLYPDMSEHTFPPDFADRFPYWVRGILRLESAVEPVRE